VFSVSWEESAFQKEQAIIVSGRGGPQKNETNFETIRQAIWETRRIGKTGKRLVSRPGRSGGKTIISILLEKRVKGGLERVSERSLEKKANGFGFSQQKNRAGHTGGGEGSWEWGCEGIALVASMLLRESATNIKEQKSMKTKKAKNSKGIQGGCALPPAVLLKG